MLPFKALVQFLLLLWFLCFKIAPPDVFIVQVRPHYNELINVTKFSTCCLVACTLHSIMDFSDWFILFSFFWILQNPPSIPTLVAVKFSSWLRHSAFIIDWHNFGYTLLGLSFGRSNILVKTYHWYILVLRSVTVSFFYQPLLLAMGKK